MLQRNYSNNRSGSGGEWITFANETKFAEAALERFSSKVDQADSHEAVQNLHFLDAEISKNQFIEEVAFKAIKFNAELRNYNQTFRLLAEANVDFAVQEGRLNAAWKEFQDRLIKATREEASIMTFNFNHG